MEVTGLGYKLEIDVDLTGMAEDFQEACVVSYDFSTGKTIDQFYTTCSSVANNVVTAIDPTIGLTMKLEDDSVAKQFLLDREDQVGAGAVFKVKITDPTQGANGTEYAFDAVISDLDRTYVTDTVVEMTGDLKVAKGETFTKTAL